MPMPFAASIRCGGTARMPASVFETIGRSVTMNSPKIAGLSPMPSRLIDSASTASVGIVAPILRIWRTISP